MASSTLVKKRRGRPKETWCRTVERELKERGLSLETAPWTAADRPKWRALTTASSARRLREDWMNEWMFTELSKRIRPMREITISKTWSPWADSNISSTNTSRRRLFRTTFKHQMTLLNCFPLSTLFKHPDVFRFASVIISTYPDSAIFLSNHVCVAH